MVDTSLTGIEVIAADEQKETERGARTYFQNAIRLAQAGQQELQTALEKELAII